MKKIKKWSKFSIPLIPCMMMLSTNAISCSSTKGFYFANFESYMSMDLESVLKDEFGNINFRSFATNEDLERNFSRNYDVAVPSAYLIAKLANKGQLEVIDWSKFDLYQLDENGNRTNKKITNAAEALTLFSEQTQIVLTKVYYLKDFPDPAQGGLLNYCVPYFLQDFILSYKSPNTFVFNNGSKDYQWSDVMNYMGQITGQGKEINRIAMIDDYRSIYSIPRLMQTNDETVNPGEPIVPNEDGTPLKPIQQQTYNVSTFEETYKYLSDKFPQKNSFLLNSDSGVILNELANYNGSKAGIMYNGDALYAAQAGDNYSGDGQFETWLTNHFNGDDFTIKLARPKDTLIVLDGMVINKNSKYKEEAYDVVKKIGLEGADISLYKTQPSENQEPVYNENSIMKCDESDNYVYGPMINFDYVQYTSPLKNLNTYVNNSTTYIDSIGGYFTNLYEYLLSDEVINNTQYKNYINLLVDIFNVPSEPTSNNMLEQNLSDVNKSNMYYAFQIIKQII